MAKVYLDDERPVPEGWIGALNAKDAIKLLSSLEVEVISLDHDLGDDTAGTGYDVLLWIEEQTYAKRYSPPAIKIHTANASARSKMEAAAESINRIAKSRAQKQIGQAS